SYFDVTLEDSSRGSQAHGDFAGSDSRVLKTRIWYPKHISSPRPLVIYSHGFMSTRTGGSYLAEHLASHGYIVAAMNYPLTTMRAAGGPYVNDVVNQPEDVGFLIDQFLSWSEEQGHQFYRAVDAERIAAVGLSLGGMTTSLLGFHRQKADPRIAAAVSIAGPTFPFGPDFYSWRQLPFMMIASPIDPMIDYATNAKFIPERVPGSILLTISNASHTGFAGPGRFMRWLNNPDSLGCAAVTKGLKNSDEDSWLQLFGGVENGIVDVQQPALCTAKPLPKAMNPIRQHWLTSLAIKAFLDTHFSPSLTKRDSANHYLRHIMAAEILEVSIAVAEDD
ncbi:MAG: alpha/beta hydrolase family protein, partial [Spongiibacteraceae bacterium]